MRERKDVFKFAAERKIEANHTRAMQKILNKLLKTCFLTLVDKQILKLCMVDGLSFLQAGALLNIKDQRANDRFYYAHSKILQQIDLIADWQRMSEQLDQNRRLLLSKLETSSEKIPIWQSIKIKELEMPNSLRSQLSKAGVCCLVDLYWLNVDNKLSELRSQRRFGPKLYNTMCDIIEPYGLKLERIKLRSRWYKKYA